MKVAISSQGKNIDSLVDPRFGRARWFIFTDTEADGWLPHDNNDNVNVGGGAGVQAGTTVAENGATAVITGNVGPNAHKVLSAAGVAVYQAGNGVTVKEALEAFRRGELTALQAPTMQGHWK
jgi:predicted Fe-Mo cluster-binding NifX family protein